MPLCSSNTMLPLSTRAKVMNTTTPRLSRCSHSTCQRPPSGTGAGPAESPAAGSAQQSPLAQWWQQQQQQQRVGAVAAAAACMQEVAAAAAATTFVLSHLCSLFPRGVGAGHDPGLEPKQIHCLPARDPPAVGERKGGLHLHLGEGGSGRVRGSGCVCGEV